MTVIATSWADYNPFKGGYSGLEQVAEINHHQVGRDGLEVALPQGNVRSGRYC
jgi:hypothetical protein